MKHILFTVVCLLAISAFAKERTKMVYVIKPDTTVRIDTTKKVTKDTLIITNHYRDTSIFIGADTVVRKYKK